MEKFGRCSVGFFEIIGDVFAVAALIGFVVLRRSHH